MTDASGLQPDYGIDAPRAVSVLVLLSILTGGLAGLLCGLGLTHQVAVLLIALVLTVVAVDLLVVAVAMLWYSRIGKMRQRDRLLDLVAWRGDESVLERRLRSWSAARRRRSTVDQR